MFDTHYDLLTIAYKAYLTGDYSYLDKISKYFNDNNVTSVIANLYFMSKEEMKEEICSNYYQDNVSVLDMFIKAKEVLDTYLPDTNILYSIEGADYIKDNNELEKLYDAGLDSLIICWNTESKYASGNRSDKGLTQLGRELINKAIDLGMGIDLSHANKNTFNDLVDLIEEKRSSGIDVVAYASHSNVRSLCDRDRNLEDEQLERLKSIDGMLGIFSNRSFVVDKSLENDDKIVREYYLSHIEYASKILGFNNIMVATDDMDFCKDADPVYGTRKIYDYPDINNDLSRDLINRFGIDITDKIISGNANKIYNKLKNNREKKRGNIK